MSLEPCNGAERGLEDSHEAAEENKGEVSMIIAVIVETTNRTLAAGHDQDAHNEGYLPRNASETAEVKNNRSCTHKAYHIEVDHIEVKF